MESPTRLSQSRFFRFGRLSKMSRKSSSAYSNHSSYSSTTSVAHPMDTISAADFPLHHHQQRSSKKSSQNKPPIATEYAVSDIYQQLNHRSASMSTLPSNMPSSSAYNVLPGYIGDLTANHYGMNQPRLSQLQTLEAKMASIAVSLSGGGGGGRRAGSSTGVSTTLNHHVNNGSSSVKSGSSPSTDTLRSSSKQSVVSNNSNNKQQPIIRQQQHSEIDLLRKIIQDKDALIQTLQQKQQQISSNVNSVQSNAMNGNNISSRATSSERQQVERRLALLNRDIDQKRGAIKNIRLSLQQTNVSDNIDARIRQAEIEYQLEREETNLLNLQDEKRQLLLRFGSGAPIQQQQQQWGRQQLQLSSLFRIVHGHAHQMLIVADKIDYDAQNPNLKLQWAASDNNRSSSALLDTCTVQWAREDINLKAGDRILEINGEPIPEQETKIVLQTGFVQVVAVRQSQANELTQRTERLVQERDALKADNLRLKHRISYLEEVRHDKELLVMTDTSDAPVQQQQQQRGKAPPPPKVTQQQQQQQIINDSMSSSGESQYRSEVHVQSATTPVRQKPPRTSKLRASSATSTDQSEVSNGGNNNNNNNKRLHSTLDAPRRTAVADEPINSIEVGDTNSVGRIKTSSIVDRHFGHVIRVTHHHHPMAPPPPQSKPPSSSSLSSRRQHRQHQIAQADSVSDLASVASYDSFIDGPPPPPSSRGHPLRHGHQQRHHQVAQSMDTLSSVSSLRHFNSHRSPPSPTRSEVQSVASMDMERRHLGYISDEQTISSSSISYKKPSSSKPIPPRKPSFLYLNRASSLQSVNGGVTKMSTAHSKHFDTDDDETGWNNNTASSKSSLRSSNPLMAKWNILSSSSRVKNADN